MNYYMGKVYRETLRPRKEGSKKEKAVVIEEGQQQIFRNFPQNNQKIHSIKNVTTTLSNKNKLLRNKSQGRYLNKDHEVPKCINFHNFLQVSSLDNKRSSYLQRNDLIGKQNSTTSKQQKKQGTKTHEQICFHLFSASPSHKKSLNQDRNKNDNTLDMKNKMKSLNHECITFWNTKFNKRQLKQELNQKKAREAQNKFFKTRKQLKLVTFRKDIHKKDMTKRPKTSSLIKRSIQNNSIYMKTENVGELQPWKGTHEDSSSQIVSYFNMTF